MKAIVLELTPKEAEAVRIALDYHVNMPSEVLEYNPAAARVWQRALDKVDAALTAATKEAPLLCRPCQARASSPRRRGSAHPPCGASGCECYCQRGTP